MSEGSGAGSGAASDAESGVSEQSEASSVVRSAVSSSGPDSDEQSGVGCQSSDGPDEDRSYQPVVNANNDSESDIGALGDDSDDDSLTCPVFQRPLVLGIAEEEDERAAARAR